LYRFGRDTESATLQKRVRDDFAGGTASGVKGTPTFFINGKRYRGEVNLEAMAAAINDLLRG
jgi:Na+:H+ antiporter, NhaA family